MILKANSNNAKLISYPFIIIHSIICIQYIFWGVFPPFHYRDYISLGKEFGSVSSWTVTALKVPLPSLF